MNTKDYQELAMRTNDGESTDRLFKNIIGCVAEGTIDLGGVLNASLGLAGEVGELNDMVKKWVFQGHELDEAEVRKELGDVCWYIALMCESFGYDLGEIMQGNVNKLMKRYPQGFSEADSINRVG